MESVHNLQHQCNFEVFSAFNMLAYTLLTAAVACMALEPLCLYMLMVGATCRVFPGA